MENVGDNLLKFLPEESWRTLDTKSFTDELEWNAWPVFLAQNPACLKALLAERCCICKSFILPQAFGDFGSGCGGHILPEWTGQASAFNKRRRTTTSENGPL
jgi:hypothetical protein